MYPAYVLYGDGSVMRNIPQHIGFIMDGNGRWAKSRFLPRTAGHLAGLKALKRVILGCIDEGVSFATLYCFSTENWRRPQDEVNYLMSLFSEKIMGEFPFYEKNGIRILTLGDISVLPEDAAKALEEVKEATKNFDRICVQLAINYGGQTEICQAVNAAIREGTMEITPQIIRSHFQNPQVPPVDLIVRSAGEFRISNFLLFDSAYAEFIFCDKLWPNWGEKDVSEVIDTYNTRVRRFGGVVQ